MDEMSLTMIARIMWMRRQLRLHENWAPEQLYKHQACDLARLRSFTVAHSPFYQRLHRGLTQAPLGELPVLTKAALMDNFDTIATNRIIRLADLQAHLDGAHDDKANRGEADHSDQFAGRYWVAATSGSSGRKSIIPSDAQEWATIIASYARANEWAGIRASPLHPVSMAVISSTTPWHQSSRVATTVRSPFIGSHRLDAASPLPDVVARLNDVQPDVLIGYASMIRALSEEQLAGRLHIAPRAVNSSSEVLTAETRAMAARAWRLPPFNGYAATETGGIAAECTHHQGMHLFEDLVIPEVVDDAYRPVPSGQPGDRLLVTVLSSRTVPLIRYEMTDRTTLATEPCLCGLPFQLLQSIEGRSDDVLTMPSGTGTIRIHPVVFHDALDLLDAAGWQVRQSDSGIDVLVATPGPGFDPSTTHAALRRALTTAGANLPPITIKRVATIPAGAAGKRPLVVARPTTP
jgi:putative adenylate-forming enzyme